MCYSSGAVPDLQNDISMTTFGLLKHTFPRLAFFSYVAEMRRMLADCRTCLDVGCGSGSPVRFLDFRHRVGIDGHEPSLARAKEAGTHDEYHVCNAQDIGQRFSDDQFDCCIALDLIEHLSKDDGYKLLEQMERIASRKVLIFTPNGFLRQESENGDMQAHLSGWDAREMQSLGFIVVGMHGHKFFRGEHHEHRFRPRTLSAVASEMSHYVFTRSHPAHAAAILCVKDVRGGS